MDENNSVTNQPPEDEIDLYEIFNVLNKKKLVIIVSVLFFIIASVIYSLFQVPKYTYKAYLNIGILGRNSKGSPIYIIPIKTAVNRIKYGQLPHVFFNFLKDHPGFQKKLSQKDFKIVNPKGSSIIGIKTAATRSLGQYVKIIQNTTLQRFVSNNYRLSVINIAALQANLKQLKATTVSLSNQKKFLLDKKIITNKDLNLLKVKLNLLKANSTAIHSQEEALRKQILVAKPLVQKSTNNVKDNATALTNIIQDNQVMQAQEELYSLKTKSYSLEMEKLVGLYKERLSLQNDIKNDRRQENNLDMQIATNQAQRVKVKLDLKAQQFTHIIYPSYRSIYSVGPGKLLIIAIGSTVGLFIGIFLAFFLEWFTKQRSLHKK